MRNRYSPIGTFASILCSHVIQTRNGFEHSEEKITKYCGNRTTENTRNETTKIGSHKSKTWLYKTRLQREVTNSSCQKIVFLKCGFTWTKLEFWIFLPKQAIWCPQGLKVMLICFSAQNLQFGSRSTERRERCVTSLWKNEKRKPSNFNAVCSSKNLISE